MAEKIGWLKNAVLGPLVPVDPATVQVGRDLFRSVSPEGKILDCDDSQCNHPEQTPAEMSEASNPRQPDQSPE